VLGGLAGSGGFFRVGGSGEVKGVAQCCGDLSFAECQDCVGDAIRRLRSECVAADYGDVFLGKCYVRFSTNGAHAYNNKAHGKAQFLKKNKVQEILWWCFLRWRKGSFLLWRLLLDSDS